MHSLSNIIISIQNNFVGFNIVNDRILVPNFGLSYWNLLIIIFIWKIAIQFLTLRWKHQAILTQGWIVLYLLLLVFRNNGCLNLILVDRRYNPTRWSCCLFHIIHSTLLASLIIILLCLPIVLVIVFIVVYTILLILSWKNSNCRPLFLMLTILAYYNFVLIIPL